MVGKTNHSKLPFSVPQRRGGRPRAVCVTHDLSIRAGESLGTQANRSCHPTLWGGHPHSIYHFCGCHSGLEFEEKGCIPGTVSRIKEDFCTDWGPAVLPGQECRCLGLRKVDRSPPPQRLPRKGIPTSHVPEHLSWDCI